MAMKHLKSYYEQVEKLYLELASELKEMEEDFKNNECTEEELQNLVIPVNNIITNYKQLAYVLFLLYQPKNDKKKAKYEKQNKDLVKYFTDEELTAQQQLTKEEASLKTFRELVKEKFNHE